MCRELKRRSLAIKRAIAVITVAPAVKYSFVSKGMQTRRTGQHKAKLTLSPRLHVKPLITVITAIGDSLCIVIVYFRHCRLFLEDAVACNF